MPDRGLRQPMSRRALARGERALRGALVLLGVASTVFGCSLLPGQSDDPTPAQAGHGGSAGGSAGTAGTASAVVPTRRIPVPIRRSQRGAGCSVANDCAVG